MRIKDGAIYLVQPVLGQRCLTGEATIGTTWLDYTFPERAAGTRAERQDGDLLPPPGCRVLIPLSNVTAVVLGAESDSSGSALP